jgi:serine/threonine protein phosphatase PrpC
MSVHEGAEAAVADDAAAEAVIAAVQTQDLPVKAADSAISEAASDAVVETHAATEQVVKEQLAKDGAAKKNSAVGKVAAGVHRSARPVIEFTPQADQSPDDAVPGDASGRIAEPPVLLGRPPRVAVNYPLPAVLDPAPDSVVDGGTVGGLIARAASIRGEDHRGFGTGRQDSVGLWALDGNQAVPGVGSVLLAAVADGVGQYPLSHLGSAAACRLVRQHVAARLKTLLLEPEPTAALVNACRETVTDIAAGLRVAAAERRLASEQFATTLVVALVVPGAEDRRARTVVFAVGDSKAGVLREGTWRDCLPSGPDAEGDGISDTGTDALPMHAHRVGATVVSLEPGDVLLLCTDGLDKPMTHNDSVRDRLAEWWGAGPVPPLPEFYWQLNFHAQTYGDDRSAVCVWVP